uniref:PHD-type domain-containing protein n=1 Tax=Graphocephala atropunctata TaxID=36148 RepID=A0A1B6MJ16_9HEMI
MGKAKPVEPEPSDKIIRVLGENLTIEVSEEEKKYRNKKGPDDVKNIRKEKLKCTVCAKSLVDLTKKLAEPFVHMVLGVLVCKDCSSFYGDGYFSVDEDGDDKYCRWCGQGGTLYLCSGCTCAFCKKCIKQNLDKQDVKDLESDDWQCLICEPKPLFECRTICWFLQDQAAKAKKGNSEEINEESTLPRSRRDRGSRKSTKEEDITPTSRKRKVSEIEDESETEKERGSKRRKSSDSGKERKSQSSSPSKRARNRSSKEKENEKEPEDESPKKIQSTSESKSKRSRGSKPEEESTPTKKSPRVSKKKEDHSKKKIEVVVTSDDEDLDDSVKEVTKKGSSSKDTKTSKTVKKQEEEENTSRPRRSTSVKSVKESKTVETTPKRPARSSDKKKSQPSEKNKKSKKAEVDSEIESPKRSQRSTKDKCSTKVEEDEENIINLNSEIHLVPLGGNSESDTESNKNIPKRKANSSKSKLHLSKNADSKVVQASGYVNSALKDIMELGVLISNRCEKLCTKSIQSREDVLSVYNKIQQLMSGVNTNLGLIEKGLDTKITSWKDLKLESNESTVEQAIEGDSGDNLETTGDNVTSPGDDVEDLEQVSDIKETENTKELEITEEKIKINLEEHKRENPEEEMEVDDNDQDKIADEEENEKDNTLNAKTENEQKENIEEKIESISETSEKTSEDKESDTEKGDREVTDTKYSENEVLSLEKANVKENSNEGENTEDDTTEKDLESADDKLKDNEENGHSHLQVSEGLENSAENCDESLNNKLDDLKERDEIREEENESVKNVPVCGSDSLDRESLDSVTKQSGAKTLSKSQDNGFGDTNTENDKIEVLGDGFSQEEPVDDKNEESFSLEVMDIDIPENQSKTESDKPAVSEENAHSLTTASEPNDSEELKNGTAVDNTPHSEKEDDKSMELNSIEQISPEKKEENRTLKTPTDEHKSSGSPHSDPSRRLSADRDRERERSRYPQEQRRSGDRGDHHGGGSWNRDRDRFQDRGWSGRGGSWNRYDDRRPNRGGWGWNR